MNLRLPDSLPGLPSIRSDNEGGADYGRRQWCPSFWFGFALSSTAIFVFFVYRYTMRGEPEAPKTVVEGDGTAGIAIRDPIPVS